MNVLTRVPKLLRIKPTITKINLYDNMIMDSGLQSLLQILLSNPQITSIDIGCNDLTDGSLLCIMEIIRDTHVKKVQLGYNQFTWQANHFSREGLSQIISTVAETNRLKCFGMRGTMSIQSKRQPTDKPISLYISKLLREATNLLTLDASNLNFNESDQNHLYTGFSQNKTLKHLNLTGNQFSQGTFLIEGITKIKSLVYLNLNSCSILTPTCLTISNALSSGWPLISLDLSNNKIGSLGISSLFNTLSTNETLTSLNISSNNFDSNIGPSLKKFMLSNHVLSSLDISKNHLSDSIALIFAETLPINDSLADLNLATTWTTDAGAVEIAKSIVRNTSLRKIIFKDNFLSTLVGFQLLDILQSNRTLLYIDLSSNQVDTFAIDAVNSLCKRNRILLKERKFLPLRKELIRLSIQKSKIPHVEENLKKLDNRLNELDQTNERLNDQIESYRDSTAVTLKAAKQAIKEFEMMISEEKNSIEDMKKMMIDMREQSKKSIIESQEKEAEEQKKFDKIMQESEKVENETAAIQNNADEQQKKMSEEIEMIEKMLEEIQQMTQDKENFHNWEIPEYSENLSSKTKENSLGSRSSSLSVLSTKRTSQSKSSKGKGSKSKSKNNFKIAETKNVAKLSARKSLKPNVKLNSKPKVFNKAKTINLAEKNLNTELTEPTKIDVSEPIDQEMSSVIDDVVGSKTFEINTIVVSENKLNLDVLQKEKKTIVVKRANSVASTRRKQIMASSFISIKKNEDNKIINTKRNTKVPHLLIQTTKK